MMHLAKNMSEAIRDYQAYLTAFDKANPTPFNPATPPTPRPQTKRRNTATPTSSDTILPSASSP